MPVIGAVELTMNVAPMGRTNHRVSVALSISGIALSPAPFRIVNVAAVGGTITNIASVNAGGVTVVSPDPKLTRVNCPTVDEKLIPGGM